MKKWNIKILIITMQFFLCFSYGTEGQEEKVVERISKFLKIESSEFLRISVPTIEFYQKDIPAKFLNEIERNSGDLNYPLVCAVLLEFTLYFDDCEWGDFLQYNEGSVASICQKALRNLDKGSAFSGHISHIKKRIASAKYLAQFKVEVKRIKDTYPLCQDDVDIWHRVLAQSSFPSGTAINEVSHVVDSLLLLDNKSTTQKELEAYAYELLRTPRELRKIVVERANSVFLGCMDNPTRLEVFQQVGFLSDPSNGCVFDAKAIRMLLRNVNNGYERHVSLLVYIGRIKDPQERMNIVEFAGKLLRRKHDAHDVSVLLRDIGELTVDRAQIVELTNALLLDDLSVRACSSIFRVLSSIPAEEREARVTLARREVNVSVKNYNYFMWSVTTLLESQVSPTLIMITPGSEYAEQDARNNERQNQRKSDQFIAEAILMCPLNPKITTIWRLPREIIFSTTSFIGGIETQKRTSLLAELAARAHRSGQLCSGAPLHNI